jgi:transitional endoplasmic reticulum ATPase
MLDGLESETSANVCVIMTAMNVGHLPAALLRSGRIELWLETKLPDASARAAILAAYLEPYASIFCDADQRDTCAEMTDEFTGADIKRMVADALILYAYDQEHGKDGFLLGDRRGEYIARAAFEVRANKQRLIASGRISQ